MPQMIASRQAAAITSNSLSPVRAESDNIPAEADGAARRFVCGRARFPMIESKRFVHPGVVFSAVGHVGLLLALLIFKGTGGVRPVAPEPIAVEIVPSDELPQTETEQVEGTPLDSTSRGSEVSSDSRYGSASTAPPRPKSNTPPSLQQAQARSDRPAGGSPAEPQPQTAPPAEGETPPLPSGALVPPAPAAQPQPHPDEAQREPNASDMFAMPLALPGGRLGGGFDAPASNPAMLPHDDTAAFRARLSACSRSAALYSMDDRTAIELRISFKRDGTLASPPQLLHSSLSADAVALTKMALDALERCQPFPELPADRYNKWKTLDLVVTPLSLSRE
jgi:hypothetical protein